MPPDKLRWAKKVLLQTKKEARGGEKCWGEIQTQATNSPHPPAAPLAQGASHSAVKGEGEVVDSL